ncbi:unnamed protein product [Enterobius vermicularis]|uniref:DSBA domain-containing protein n=1 Tax=Enterobius vermicularis TaxID=51028 RepID=A0A0N4UY63_ENTVE|nr:unnamed protein product [Enterobius vermicularis]
MVSLKRKYLLEELTALGQPYGIKFSIPEDVTSFEVHRSRPAYLLINLLSRKRPDLLENALDLMWKSILGDGKPIERSPHLFKKYLTCDDSSQEKSDIYWFKTFFRNVLGIKALTDHVQCGNWRSRIVTFIENGWKLRISCFMISKIGLFIWKFCREAGLSFREADDMVSKTESPDNVRSYRQNVSFAMSQGVYDTPWFLISDENEQSLGLHGLFHIPQIDFIIDNPSLLSSFGCPLKEGDFEKFYAVTKRFRIFAA